MVLRDRLTLAASLFTIFLYGFLFAAKSSRAYYSCGGNPCNASYPCNVPLSCNGGVCGVYYDSCVGPTCVDNNGWDATTCSTTNQCTNPGTTATANWSACSATCGNGVFTCQAGTVNGCTARCASPDAAIGGTTPCCISQIPNTTPSAVTCNQVPLTRTAQVNWTFSDTGSNCGLAWGLNCGGNANSFQLRFSGGKATENASSAVRTDTTDVFANWGTYTVQVCALNGYGERCSGAVNCVLTQPVCSVGSQDATNVTNPDSTCTAVNPVLSATYGNNANEMRFLIDDASNLLSPLQTSAWSAATTYTPAPTLATGRYYWNVQSRSTAVPADCSTPAAPPAGRELNLDYDPPTVPNGTFDTLQPDPSCLSSYFVTYRWPASTDPGCGNMNTAPYQANISNNAGYLNSGTNINDDSGWQLPLFYQSPRAYSAGTTLYGRARARDEFGNTSVWSSTAATAFVIPTPTAYPPIIIRGTYTEDTGTSSPNCTAGGMTLDPTLLNLSLTHSNEATSSCTLNGTDYNCLVYVNNQDPAHYCADPNQNISLNATYGGYEDVEWRANNECNGAIIPSITVNSASPNPAPSPIETFFKYGAKGWFKTKNTSFTNKATRDNILPNSPLPFDGDDSVAGNDKKFMTIGQGGAVLYDTTNNNLNLGANATLGFSDNNFRKADYDALTLFSPNKFFDYVKSRKQYKTITGPADIDSDGIYYIAGNLTIDEAADVAPFLNRNVLVVVTGFVNISVDFVPPAGQNLWTGFIADSIQVGAGVGTVKAVLIGNSVDVNSSNTPLKIDGNLISLTNTFNNTRVLINANTPSLFIVQNQETYMKLLPYLSTSMYDWRQIQ